MARSFEKFPILFNRTLTKSDINSNGLHKRKHLNGDSLFLALKSVFDKIPDKRNGNIKYSISDTLMSIFCIFSIKDPSLLQFEQRINDEETVALNLKKIFHINDIPSDTQMREIADNIDSFSIEKGFKKIFTEIQRGKGLEPFKFMDKYYIASMDGTGYFSSKNISCENCQIKNHRNGEITYSHAMLGIAIVHPDKKQVIPLAPEPIIKQDGNTKNDCERNAAKRLLENLRKDHPHLPLIIVEDGLSSNAPHIEELEKYNLRYILGVKPGDHSYLFNLVEENKKNGKVNQFDIEKDGIIHQFEYINQVSLNKVNAEKKVNFLFYKEIKNGKTKKFSWITDFEITNENAFELMRGGRARWKIENETFNTLKNQGYQFEHNFGHGEKNLSVNFALLMMLAFLVDQVQELYSKTFQAALEKKQRRKYLWDTIKAYIKTLIFDSWDILLNAVIYGLETLGFKIRMDSS